ncbi:MAG TPA: hypothetical protein DIT95_08830, partial [Arenibacter sp.]|nr:hypothetical protein [Arenibacter sp.]
MEKIETIHELQKKLAKTKGKSELFFALKTKAFDIDINLILDEIDIHESEHPFVEIKFKDPNEYVYHARKDREKIRA